MAVKKSSQKAHVSKAKLKTVEELKKLVEGNKTVLVASIKNLPAADFQAIGKKLRGKAVVKVPKKNLIFKAIDESGKAEELKKIIDRDVAILFSNEDAFELAGELLQNKSPAKAKPGQEAPMDIEVKAGPTELVPGPAISELGSVGLQVEVKEGKLAIKQDKVIVKKGEKISEKAAGIMAKLDIKPFSIGFIPVAAFDSEAKKVYTEININPEETIAQLKEAYGRALPFAVSVGYISKDTIGFLLGKASAHANKINRIMTGEPEPVAAPVEESKEEVKEEPKTEEKREAAAEGLGALFG